MRLIFISAMDYNAAGAAQARQLSVIQYLAKQGFNVELFNLRARTNFRFQINTRFFPNLAYHIPWRVSLILFYLPMLIGLCFSGQNNKTSIFCYDRDPWILGGAILAAKLFRYPVMHELTEFPSEVRPKGLYGITLILLFERVFLKLITGAIVISRSLVGYVRSYSQNISIIMIPSLVDFNRFNELKRLNNSLDSSIQNTFRFVYTGSLNEQKDGVVSMIRALALAQEIVQSITLELYIYGSGSEHEINLLKNEIGIYHLDQQIKIKGSVPPDQIPTIMFGADALLLCRPFSKQAKGGFPTKLAEYLASGKPVLTTITSDIARYLKDGETAYLSPPNDTQYIAKRMVEIVCNLEKSALVGRNGRGVAKKHFDAELNTLKIGGWIKSLHSVERK